MDLEGQDWRNKRERIHCLMRWTRSDCPNYDFLSRVMSKIPVEFLAALVQKLSAGAQLNGEELAHQFQIAVTDYKYLSEKWARYRPSARGEPVKTQALKYLQAADLESAWRMFIDLPKPGPPTAVQIISAIKSAESR